MAKVVKRNVEFTATGATFVVPTDCTAVRVSSDVSVTVVANDGVQNTDTPSAATSVLIDSKCFGRTITVTGTSITVLKVTVEVG